MGFEEVEPVSMVQFSVEFVRTVPPYKCSVSRLSGRTDASRCWKRFILDPWLITHNAKLHLSGGICSPFANEMKTISEGDVGIRKSLLTLKL